MMIQPEYAFPLFSKEGEFYSEMFWYAFYGVKNSTIYEFHRLKGYKCLPVIMKHDGRFQNNSRFDSVIISIPQYTFVYENPYSTKLIDHDFIEGLVRLLRLEIQLSYMSLFRGDLKLLIERERQQLLFLADKLIYRL